MTLALVQHAAPADRLHIWIGIADHPAAPALAWQLDGQARVPDAVLAALAPVLSDELAKKARTTVFSGFFEFTGLAPGSDHTVEVQAGGERIVRRVRTMPDAVPEGPQDRFNLLLLSCFHQLEDKTGTAGQVLSQLKVTPHLALFTGDQVYLDLPTLKNFKKDATWLANKFQDDYINNWFGPRDQSTDSIAVPRGFPQMLALAPSAFMPDDHEFWNNYPSWSSPIENSWTEEGRKNWTRAAETVYRGFQQTAAAPFGAARTLDIAPLSILLLDTRSQRTPGSLTKPNDLLGPAGRTALRTWADGLVQSAGTLTPRFGLLVTGQSFFSPAAGAIKGAITDYEFRDYTADYAFMLDQIERVNQADLPLILATGDVHWGRVLFAVNPALPNAPVFEVISSSTSLVSTIISDQAKQLWGGIKGLFGERDPWPRHGDPDNPPPRFGATNEYTTAVLERDGGGTKLAAMRGNQAYMLRFARLAAGLDVLVTCFPLSGDDSLNAQDQWSTSFRLRSPRN